MQSVRCGLFLLASMACACASAVVDRDAASPDAAAGVDAAPGVDGGSERDAAGALDALPAPDATPMIDATPMMDATPAPDATSAPDAVVAMDTGSEPGCPPTPGANPAANMSFFVTSVGSGASGGNLGGLAGADRKCQCLAAAVGRGQRTWRAYLSTSPAAGAGALVHARDRIGSGPWFNYAGALIAPDLDALHATPPSPTLILTETGLTAPQPEHDILTGSDRSGRSFDAFPDNPVAPPPTCANWTDGTDRAYAWVGHSDWIEGQSWSSAHPSLCSPAGLQATAGAGRIYCFAE